MKRTNIYTLATLALLFGIVACTQEENMTDPGTTLLDGPYPLQIGTVTVSSEVSDGVQTRVAETSDGSGSVFETDDVITVQLGDETATYTFNGTSWTTDTQLYWTAAGQTLTAWYTSPDYTNEGTIDLSDQSNGLVYVLRATADFAQTVNLDFTHQLAKVRVVTTGSYDTSDSVLKLTAHTKLTVSQGEITETGSEGRITMYKTSYEDEDVDNGSITCWEATVPDNTTISSVTIDGTTCELYNTVTTEAGKLHTITLNVAEDPGYTYDQEANTYKVYAANGLLAWNQAAFNDPSISCTLAADIDLRGINYTWLQVGNYRNRYTGTFEGGDHTITGLTINEEETDYVGLIGYLGSDGKVQNLTLDNVSITGSSYVGGVAGYNNSGTVTNCAVSGSVSGSSDIGGVVGCNYGGTVTDCNSSSSVSGSGDCVGGVVGYNNIGGAVTACYSTDSVIGSSRVGGVVGYNNTGTATACYSTGSISGSSNVGGVVGYTFSGVVTACYHASGSVSGSLNVDDVVGYIFFGTVTDCYYSYDDGEDCTSYDDGSSTTWQDAVTNMNSAISTSGWLYEIANGNTLPTLKKNE